MAFFVQFFILTVHFLQVLSQSINNRVYHFMLLVQVVSQLILSFLWLLLKCEKFFFQLVYNGIKFVLELFIRFLVILNFLLCLFWCLNTLLLVLFVGFAQFSIFLWIKIGLLLYLNHTFHHSHGKSVVLVSDSLNIDLELLLNTMKLNS